MSIIERLKKYEGLNKDKDRCPPNPGITVRDAIEIANHIAGLEKTIASLRERSGTCPKCPHGKGFKCPVCWPKKD